LFSLISSIGSSGGGNSSIISLIDFICLSGHGDNGGVIGLFCDFLSVSQYSQIILLPYFIIDSIGVGLLQLQQCVLYLAIELFSYLSGI